MTIMRPSCEHCPYTDIHRASDITIADYWGIEKYSSEW
ncbi:MAG: Coenzyme F420 hydrogenase/dehydrogenase, beta subunit C-terminal domain [Clostridium sp.]|nr:Coenzyme F420 hydrogenase/dehydrogenase, beta subunit C-terminal domain [Clostridium sp.]